MKRYMAICLIIVLLLLLISTADCEESNEENETITHSELVNIESLNLNELLDLQSRIDQRILTLSPYEPTFLYEGKYVIGKDLDVGSYLFDCVYVEDNYFDQCYVHFYSKDNRTGKYIEKAEGWGFNFYLGDKYSMSFNLNDMIEIDDGILVAHRRKLKEDNDSSIETTVSYVFAIEDTENKKNAEESNISKYDMQNESSDGKKTNNVEDSIEINYNEETDPLIIQSKKEHSEQTKDDTISEQSQKTNEAIEIDSQNLFSEITQPMTDFAQLPSKSSNNCVVGITKCYIDTANENQKFYCAGYAFVNEYNYDGTKAKNWLIIYNSDTNTSVCGYHLKQKPNISGMKFVDAVCSNANDSDFEVAFDISEFKDGVYTFVMVLGYVNSENGNPTYKAHYLSDSINFEVKDGHIINTNGLTY